MAETVDVAPPSIDVALRNMKFDELESNADMAASFAKSAREAAYRGDQLTLGVHLKQLRVTVIAALKTFKELEEGTT